MDTIKKNVVASAVKQSVNCRKLLCCACNDVLAETLFFLFFFFSFFNANAQKNTCTLHIIYEVNSDEKLPLKKNVFKLNDSLSVYSKLYELKSDLINKGFLAASIDSVRKDSLHYYAYLHIGAQYRWKLSTDSIAHQALKSAKVNNKSFSGQKINIHEYLQKRNALLMYYDNTGYPFAEINIDNLIIEKNFITGDLKIKKNQKFYFDTLYIKGKLKIAPKLIFHYTGIKSGDEFSGVVLRQIDENIQRLPYVTVIKPAELEFFPGKVDLYVYLKKRKSNFFSGILGFASNEQNNEIKLTGNIRLDLNNSFGIGENIKLQWESYADSSQYLSTSLKFPYLFFVPLGIAAGFELDKTAMDYLNMNYAFSLSYDFTPGNGIQMFFRRKQSFLIDDENGKNINSTDNSTWGMAVSLDRTNRLLAPTDGLKISLATGYGTRLIEQDDKNSLFDADFYFAYYLPLSNHFNLLLRNVSAGMFNDDGFYENEMFKLGGILTIRGFDEKSILASAYTVFTLEQRFFIGKYSFLSAFADYAYFNAEGIDVQTSSTALGLGAGINIDTKAGIFSLNFAVGSINGQAFRLSNTKVHVGYVARF